MAIFKVINSKKINVVGPTITASNVIFVTGNLPALVYAYDPGTKSSILLNVTGISSASSTVDVAHTQNKLWLGPYSSIVNEWNITSSPFSAVFNRSISNIPNSAGLCAVNDNTLIGISGTQVYECNITNNVSINTLKITLETGDNISGDYLLTTTGKFIATTYNTITGFIYISQYDYNTGNLEMRSNISSTIQSPYGVYEYGTSIYIANGDGKLYNISKTTPYGLTLEDTVPYSIYGASQIPSYLTNHFT